MTRGSFIFFVLILLGCAVSDPGSTDLLGGPQIRTVLAGEMEGGGDVNTATIRYVDDPAIVQDVVNAPLGVVWPVLIEAFRTEGLEPDGADPESGLLTLNRMEWSSERNGTPLSSFLDCGYSSTGRPLADDSRVMSSIASQVSSEGDDLTRVAIRLDARAFPFDASSGNVRGCTSEGTLEQAIIRRVQDALEPVPSGTAIEFATLPTGTATDYVSGGLVDLVDFPAEPGDQMRVWVVPSIRLTGSFMGIRQDTLLLRRSRRTALPLWAVDSVQVKRTHRSATIVGSIVGIAAGVAVALNTDLGIVGRHAVQGELLNPGLGGLVGGLLGAGLGTLLFGTTWENVPLDQVKPGAMDPAGRDNSP